MTTVTILAPHLTRENHRAVLVEATHRSKEEVKVIRARLAPRPDVPPTIRKLPDPVPVVATVRAAPEHTGSATGTAPLLVLQSPPQPRRPVIEPLAPERYRLQLTMGKVTHDRLRRLQDLLAREIPGGDPALIVDRALALLLKDVEKKSWARSRSRGHPGRRSPGRAMSRRTSAAPSAGATVIVARSSQRTAGGVRKGGSSSGTT
jgi:hypothetical protein